MCKPSCCRSGSTSGLGVVAMIIIGFAVVIVIAGPVIRFIEKLLIIAAITFACLAGVAVLAGVVALAMRYRQTISAFIIRRPDRCQQPAVTPSSLMELGSVPACRALQSPSSRHLVIMRMEDNADAIEEKFLP